MGGGGKDGRPNGEKGDENGILAPGGILIIGGGMRPENDNFYTP